MPNSLSGRINGISPADNGDASPNTLERLESMTTSEFALYLKKNGVEIRAEQGKLKLSASRGFLTPVLQSELQRRKENLLDYLSNNGSTWSDDVAPLTYAQERLWLLSRFGSNGATYNIPQAWSIRGELDRSALKSAIQELVRRHIVLSSRIAVRDGKALQIASQEPDVPMQVVVVEESDSESSIEEKVLSVCIQEGRKPFDLEAGPLIRFVLFEIGKERHVLLMCVHHIVADQHSLNILKRDLRAIYESHQSKSKSALPPIELSYFELARKEFAFGNSTLCADQLCYWRERLKSAPPLLELPFGKNRPARSSDKGARYIEYLDQGITADLRKLAAELNASLYTLILSVFLLLIYRYTGERDLCIGTPKSNRKRTEHADMVGLFLNMLPIRFRIDPEESSVQMIGRLQSLTLSDFEHGDVPFQMIVDELKPERSASYPPLFQIMFSLNPKGITPEEDELEIDLGIAKYDLSLQISEKQDLLEAHVEFRTELFERGEIQRFAGHLHQLARSVANSSKVPVKHLSILCYEDRVAIADFNNTEAPINREATIISLFEEQALACRDAVALLTDEGSYTYAWLNERAQRIASKLLEAGVERGTLVGVCLGRSVELIVTLLAIFKAGAAYLPLDPKYPDERLAYMLSDSTASYLIADRSLLPSNLRERVSGITFYWASDLFSYAGSGSVALSGRAGFPGQVSGPEDMAYVIYTSGSTGAPKGTSVKHRNVVALLSWADSYFDRESKKYVVASTSVCFDLSVFELFLPLTTGNAVILVDSILELSRNKYASQATLINTVPSAMRALLAAGLPSSVRTVCLAGELLPTELVDRIYEAGVKEVFDLYGPTETTTYSTCGLRLAGIAANIGRPIANTRIYLLDENLQQVSVGAMGEIFIGGAGVTDGYLNREHLTQEKFMSIPFVDPTSRLYRTGDLAVQSSDGTLTYKGRRDHQIKLRGHRIELGEVESILSELCDGSQVAVVLSDQGDGSFLSAFVEAASIDLNEASLKYELKRRLPAFMLPSHIARLERLPRTPSGKVDRAALVSWRTIPVIASTEYPATLLEQAVANIFAAKLRLFEVDRNAHFFDDLGGHSLAAYEIFLEIEKRLQVSMTPSMLFQAPTVRLLAAASEGRAWHEPERIRFIRAGSSRTVVYWFGSGPIPRERFSAHNDLRIMSLEIASEFDIGAAAAEVVSFEASHPRLMVVGSKPRERLIRRFAASLSAVGFVSVEVEIAPQIATLMG